MSASDAPSPWVERFAPLIRAGGTVLDVACGGGRHARFVRASGRRVVAVDVDVSGVRDMEPDEDVEIMEADLESGEWPFEGRVFDGIIVTNYLHRPHFPLLVDALDDDGVLIFETFARGHERYGRPANPAFLLKPNELLRAFSEELVVVAYQHGFEERPRPSVRQRICAVKGTAEIVRPLGAASFQSAGKA